MLWGAEAHLRELFGDGLALARPTERVFTFRFRSPRSSSTSSGAGTGPTLKALAALEGGARDALERDLVSLAHRWDRLGGTSAVAIPATYIEAVAVTR